MNNTPTLHLLQRRKELLLELESVNRALAAEGDLLHRILDGVCKVFSMDPQYIIGRRRPNDVVFARFAFCLLARQLTSMGTKVIGQFLRRDHTTVIHASKVAQALTESDIDFGRKVDAVKAALFR